MVEAVLRLMVAKVPLVKNRPWFVSNGMAIGMFQYYTYVNLTEIIIYNCHRVSVDLSSPHVAKSIPRQALARRRAALNRSGNLNGQFHSGRVSSIHG